MSSSPFQLSVDLGPLPADNIQGGILGGLRGLWECEELCDVVLTVGDQKFSAHGAVLAAASSVFRQILVEHYKSRSESSDRFITIQLDEINFAESVKAMLECVYGAGAQDTASIMGNFCPSCEAANRDVIRLAKRFHLPLLQAKAEHWMTQSLTTANVLERLAACEEFKLENVREKILEQLTANPGALYVLATDPTVVTVPIVLRDLLLRVLNLLGCSQENQSGTAATPNPAPTKGTQGNAKRARKAGA
mmetsp:Transcript_15504/g.33604  ORF Transcript_15504/g.33604 Transcript_15504/m.33604 type:complete len:249 (+) Transcript_15504:93-839(+)|eukprot:CAMPEP_0194760754 /NCGR_PEP_ID=MMETSP0323_2-20130528/13604_1 /TAXON_ID=2866 ORGANISM="Crypthecodinium cohnii, Strain Seligo" /NCGR_SAMPLE_ID=MMETSP0323_2 /ASSEMBLY_ACC=CAM_ASM_000346 /LENGTH=248 /DNA_ID=CAMNT_0039682177 /DNA_START=44 /DNA_END=790 /DNA_ORIENTATION=+